MVAQLCVGQEGSFSRQPSPSAARSLQTALGGLHTAWFLDCCICVYHNPFLVTLLMELLTLGFYVCVVIVKVALKYVTNAVYFIGGMRSNHTLPLLSLGLVYWPKQHSPVIIKC